MATDLQTRAPPRLRRHKGTVALLRPCGHLAGALDVGDAVGVKRQLDRFVKVRELIRKASRKALDIQPFEADRRHLFDRDIGAALAPVGDRSLLALGVKRLSRHGEIQAKWHRDRLREAVVCRAGLCSG